MFHALCASDGMGASHHTEVGCHKTHGRACCLDVDLLRHVAKGMNDHFRIIAVAEILRHVYAATEGIDDQRTVGDTL